MILGSLRRGSRWRMADVSVGVGAMVVNVEVEAGAKLEERGTGDASPLVAGPDFSVQVGSGTFYRTW